MSNPWPAGGDIGTNETVDDRQAEISNGQITAKIYLPDVKNGYYRSTRLDWSGTRKLPMKQRSPRWDLDRPPELPLT